MIIIFIAVFAPILLSVVISIVVGAGTCAAGIVASGAAGNAIEGGGGGLVFSSSWDGRSPLQCRSGDQITVRGVSASIPAGTAISAMGNCQLVLINCSVTAPEAIIASGHATVIIQGGAITGGTTALRASGGSRIIVQGAQVFGQVRRSGNATITGL